MSLRRDGTDAPSYRIGIGRDWPHRTLAVFPTVVTIGGSSRDPSVPSHGERFMVRISAFADEISKDPIEQLDVLEKHGIRHIEFRSIHGVNVLDLGDAQHEEFRTLLRSRGFALSAIGSPIGKIKITEPFESHLERFALAM